LKAVNKCVTDSGAFTVTLETPQQGLDMIESAIANACGPDLATKIKLAVNIGANEIFDHV
jgi:enolase